MKKIFSAIGVVLLGAIVYLLFFAQPAMTSITNYPGEGTTIVAFGDSLVEGVGATTGNDFVSVLSGEIGEPIVNLGVSGDTTRDGLKRIDEVIAQDPKLVIVLLGGNDYLQSIPPAETFGNISRIIEIIHESGAMVLLLGVRGGLLTDSYKSEYEKIAQAYNVAYVPDMLDGLFGKSAVMSDPIHPNDAGYALMSQRILPVLQALQP